MKSVCIILFFAFCSRTTTNDQECKSPFELQYSDDCKEKIQCVWGKQNKIRCPDTLVFNADGVCDYSDTTHGDCKKAANPCHTNPCGEGLTCVYSGNGRTFDCIKNEKEKKEELCDKKLTIVERCEMDPSLVIPHDWHCHQFFNCSLKYYTRVPMYFEQHLDECPYPFQFSTVTNTCKNFTEVQCGNRHEENEGCGYLKTVCPAGECEPCQIKYPSCEGLADGLYEHSYKKNPWYMICNKERMVASDICPYHKHIGSIVDGKCVP